MAAKSFKDKMAQDDTRLDAANDAVEGNGGNIDGDPSANFRRRKMTDDKDKETGDSDDQSLAGAEADDSSGADGYADPGVGDVDNADDTGDDPVEVTKAQEIVTVMKAEDFMDAVMSGIEVVVRKCMAEIIPPHLAQCVGEAFRKELAPVNANIVNLSKGFDAWTDHFDERADDLDNQNMEITKALSLSVSDVQPLRQHVPLTKSETVEAPAATGPVLQPNKVTEKYTEVQSLCKAAQVYQESTGNRVPGYADVALAISNHRAIAPVMVDKLKAGLKDVGALETA